MQIGLLKSYSFVLMSPDNGDLLLKLVGEFIYMDELWFCINCVHFYVDILLHPQCKKWKILNVLIYVPAYATDMHIWIQLLSFVISYRLFQSFLTDLQSRDQLRR
jgi:hypothetical protein